MRSQTLPLTSRARKLVLMRYVVFDIETTGLAGPTRDLLELEIALVGVYDSETQAYTTYVREELPKLWPVLERTDLLIGYNSNTFDIPLLNRYYPGDLTHIPSLDLLAEVYKTLGRRLRLDSIARATLGRGKKGDGLKAIDWWREGKVDKVREYCIEDVRLTHELYEYAVKNGLLKYKDLGKARDLKIDTTLWGKDVSVPTMTHTLAL